MLSNIPEYILNDAIYLKPHCTTTPHTQKSSPRTNRVRPSIMLYRNVEPHLCSSLQTETHPNHAVPLKWSLLPRVESCSRRQHIHSRPLLYTQKCGLRVCSMRLMLLMLLALWWVEV